MRVGLLGAGNISRTMSKTIAAMEDVQNYAVASRDLAKARAFAEECGIEKAYGSYEEMLAKRWIWSMLRRLIPIIMSGRSRH